MQIKKLKAVTLVELLVVLTILGVVAALTIPGLSKHSQRTEYAKLAQKGYVTLEGAIDLAVAETEKEPDEWSDNDMGSYMLRDYLAKHMVKARDCASTWTTGACFSSYRSYKSESKSSPSTRSVMLPDGIVIAGAGRIGTGTARFYIDVNGANEPNMEGVDVFIFDFGKFNAKCVLDKTNGQWKLCPLEHAKNLMEDNWTITYW